MQYKPIELTNPLEESNFTSEFSYSNRNRTSITQLFISHFFPPTYTNNHKRIKFRDRSDIFQGRYFIFTTLYGSFYLLGGIIGYSRKQNPLCLGLSTACGCLLIIFAVIHAVDYYRGASIEAIYVVIPLVLSLFMAILMTCAYALGSTFRTSIVIAIVAWVASCLYIYAVLKDHGRGNYYRVNDFQSKNRSSVNGDNLQRYNISNDSDELAKLIFRE